MRESQCRFYHPHKLTRHRWQIAHIAILIEAYSIVFTMDYLNHETILVGGLEHFLFFHILGIIIIPTDYIIFFRGVETTNQNTIDWLLQRISPITW